MKYGRSRKVWTDPYVFFFFFFSYCRLLTMTDGLERPCLLLLFSFFFSFFYYRCTQHPPQSLIEGDREREREREIRKEGRKERMNEISKEGRQEIERDTEIDR